jgi:uncharacterized membrane protein YgdD (TMEM256/DUF423 family)
MDRGSARRDWWTSVAALNGLLAVAAGALAAHGMRNGADPRALEWVKTAAAYQMWHALALLGIRALGRPEVAAWLCAGAWLFLAGILLFCGSLYLLALTHVMAVAWITPFGGTAFLFGWLAVIVHGLRQRS